MGTREGRVLRGMEGVGCTAGLGVMSYEHERHST